MIVTVRLITDIWLASSYLIVKILSISGEKTVFHVHRNKKELFEAGVLQLLGSRLHLRIFAKKSFLGQQYLAN